MMPNDILARDVTGEQKEQKLAVPSPGHHHQASSSSAEENQHGEKIGKNVACGDLDGHCLR